MNTGQLSTGVSYLDRLLDGLRAGDNVVWQVESGAPVEFFIRSFLLDAAREDKSITFVSFNHSPQSVLDRYVSEEHLPRFHLVDAFTSGFDKGEQVFADFCDSPESQLIRTTRVGELLSAEHLSQVMDRISEEAGGDGRYVFDSLTGMRDLCGGDQQGLKFLSYICPKLYDLGALAYWMTEKDAHWSSFLANVLQITQVVLDLDTGTNGIALTVQKADGRPGCCIGVPHYFASIDGRPEPVPEQRDQLEMRLLCEIGTALGSSLDLALVFEAIMQVLARGLDMRRGTLVLQDRATGLLRIAAAHGLSEEEMARGVYGMGEGITGAVVETGESVIVPDIRQDPGFLDRTRARRRDRGGPSIAFVCVPLRAEDRVIGALSIDREFTDDETAQKDERLLRIVGAMISQAIRIHRMLAVEKEELLRAVGPGPLPTSRYAVGNIVGASPKMQAVLASTKIIAQSNATVFICGETGTGKELVARVIHGDSPRAASPFVAVNCGALTDSLLESELFGHVKGAYTGAVGNRVGRFELAHNGTIFLDEVSSMSPQLQVKLVRVLQEKTFERVGSSEPTKVDVRVVAATNVDLREEVAQHRFREDLFYRLNVVPIHLPPLRERREDIPVLVEHFLEVFSNENNKEVGKLSREVLDLLLAYDWPGNVRELENCIERAVVMSQSGNFTAELLPEHIRNADRTRKPDFRGTPEAMLSSLVARLRRTSEGDLYDTFIHVVEKSLIEHVLAANDGVQTRTARELGISRNTLRNRVREYDLGARLPGRDACP